MLICLRPNRQYENQVFSIFFFLSLFYILRNIVGRIHKWKEESHASHRLSIEKLMMEISFEL